MKQRIVSAWVSTTQHEPWRKEQCPSAGGARGPANLAASGTRHQVWEGFGGCFNEVGWEALGGLSPDQRVKVLRELFDPARGCRFNLCRLPIGASDYGSSWYSLNETAGDFAMRRFSIARDQAGLIPYIRLAQTIRPDLKLFASPWSPPTWLKNPPVFNYGKLIWKRKYLDAYALYFVKFVKAYQAEGIPISQIHVQNEPVADQKFPSCLWSGEEMRDFVRDHLGPAFRKHAIDAEIWLGTLNTDDYNGFPFTVLSDTRARAYIAGVGFQWAGKGAVQRTHASWPGVRLMQTENECGEGKNTWEYARYVCGLMQHYIANGVGGYIYWNMVLPPGGRSTWGWPQNAMITADPQSRKVVLNPEFYVMKHHAHFIQPGAVRLGLEGPWTGNALAFANPNGAEIYVVQNPTPKPMPLVLQATGARFALTLKPDSINTICVR